MSISTISIIVKGKVQGVFYRQSAREIAEKAGITGSVKNLPDGSVKIIATGDQQQLDQLTQWCRKGPSKAVVSSVETTSLLLELFTKFVIDKNK